MVQPPQQNKMCASYRNTMIDPGSPTIRPLHDGRMHAQNGSRVAQNCDLAGEFMSKYNMTIGAKNRTILNFNRRPVEIGKPACYTKRTVLV